MKKWMVTLDDGRRFVEEARSWTDLVDKYPNWKSIYHLVDN